MTGELGARRSKSVKYKSERRAASPPKHKVGDHIFHIPNFKRVLVSNYANATAVFLFSTLQTPENPMLLLFL